MLEEASTTPKEGVYYCKWLVDASSSVGMIDHLNNKQQGKHPQWGKPMVDISGYKHFQSKPTVEEPFYCIQERGLLLERPSWRTCSQRYQRSAFPFRHGRCFSLL